MKVLVERVFRIGKQSLMVNEAGEFFLRLQNRTMDTTYPIPRDRAHLHYQSMRG